jgi:hypothetical protein
MKVFVLVSWQEQITGHNTSGKFPILEQVGVHGWDFQGWHPAFVSRQAAEHYIGSLKHLYMREGLKIVELELK